MSFETDESVLLIEVSLIQTCPYREVPTKHMCILCRGADIAASDEDSYTPLLITAVHGQVDALNKLLDRGAPVDDLDKDGKSVVFVASEENHTGVLRVRRRHVYMCPVFSHLSWLWMLFRYIFSTY